jgi:hypothetical protein
MIQAGLDAVECVPVYAAFADHSAVIGTGGSLLVLDNHVQFRGNVGSLEFSGEFLALPPAGAAEGNTQSKRD